MSSSRFIPVAAFAIGVILAAYQGSQASPTPVPDAATLFRKSLRAIHIEHETSVYTMRLIGPSGEEGVRRMHVWFKSPSDEDNKLLIKFTEPASIRGTGLLTITEKGKTPDQWLYLPAYRKVRRVRQGNENESFLGSDFTMADISIQHEGSFKFTVEGTKKCGDGECYVLVGTPKPELDRDQQSYSKKVVFIRTDSYLNVKTEFYNQANQLEKIMELQGVRKDGANRWVADRMEMRNILVNHRTIIEFEKRDTKSVPPDHIFTQAHMEKGA